MTDRTTQRFLVFLAPLLAFGGAGLIRAESATPPPSPSAASAAAAAAAPSDPADDPAWQASRRIDARLLDVAGGPAAHTTYLLNLAWNSEERDAELRAAAVRRLRVTDARLVAASVEQLLSSGAPPQMRVEMMTLMAELWVGLGGKHPSLEAAMAAQIRAPQQSVASTAIAVCSKLGITDAYFPLRELAARPGPLQVDAIRGLGLLKDARGAVFLGKLLESEGAPRTEVFKALSGIGRPAALVIKTKLDDPDPDVRSEALDALLEIATADDLTALYQYTQKYPPEGELKQRIYGAIAEIEAKFYERPLINEGD